MPNKERIIFEKINYNHIDGLIKLHYKVAIKENFLPLLGNEVMGAFYKWWIGREDTIGFVATIDDKVIGHVLCPLQINYRASLNRFLLAFIPKGILNAFIHYPFRTIKLLYNRLPMIINFCISLIFRKKSKSFRNDMSDKRAIMLSLAVDPEYQGKGIAKHLSDLFFNEAKNKGKNLVVLSVRNSNARAINFYFKTGWNILEKKGNALYMYKEL